METGTGKDIMNEIINNIKKINFKSIIDDIKKNTLNNYNNFLISKGCSVDTISILNKEYIEYSKGSQCIYVYKRGDKANKRCQINVKNGNLCSKHKKYSEKTQLQLDLSLITEEPSSNEEFFEEEEEENENDNDNDNDNDEENDDKDENEDDEDEDDEDEDDEDDEDD